MIFNWNVFTAWFGPMPEYIKYCISTIKSCCSNVYVIDESNTSKYLDVQTVKDLQKIKKLAHRVDCLRVFLIQKYGGYWIDADTVMIRDIEPLFKIIETHQIAYMRWVDGRVLNGYFGGKAFSNIMSQWKRIITEKMKRGKEPESWTEYGEKIITPLIDKNKIQAKEIKRETFIPINFDRDAEIFFKKLPMPDISKAYGIALNHSYFEWKGKNIVKQSIDEILNRNDMLKEIFSMKTEKTDEAKKVFEDFYRNAGFYGEVKSDVESLSGRGSNMHYTENLRNAIKETVKKYEIKKIVDLGCGDFYWMRELIKELYEIGVEEYVGIDVAESVIGKNAEKYSQESDPKVSFKSKNIAANGVHGKIERADLIICRDVLGHLPVEMGMQAIENMKRSKSTYLLSTTFTGEHRHGSIEIGGWQVVQLDKEPYSLGTPIEMFQETHDDNVLASQKHVGVWKIN